MANRPTTSGHRLDRHDWRHDPDTGFASFIIQLKFAIETGNISTGTSHIEPQHFFESQLLGDFCSPNNASRWPRKHRVFPRKHRSSGQCSGGSHQSKLAFGIEPGLNFVQVYCQHWIQIRIQDCRFSTGQNFNQRRDLRRKPNVVEANFSRDFTYELFVFGVSVSVHQTNRKRLDSLRLKLLQLISNLR